MVVTLLADLLVTDLFAALLLAEGIILGARCVIRGAILGAAWLVDLVLVVLFMLVVLFELFARLILFVSLVLAGVVLAGAASRFVSMRFVSVVVARVVLGAVTAERAGFGTARLVLSMLLLGIATAPGLVAVLRVVRLLTRACSEVVTPVS